MFAFVVVLALPLLSPILFYTIPLASSTEDTCVNHCNSRPYSASLLQVPPPSQSKALEAYIAKHPLANPTCSDESRLSFPAGARKPVMWVHLHKEAGTTFCCEARRREMVVSPSVNCNRQFSVGIDMDGFNLVPGKESRRSWTTCEERAAYMKSGNFSWGAIERELVDGDICKAQFIYATVLREPLQTMLSALDYHQHKQALSDPPAVVACIRSGSCPEYNGDQTWKLLDNYKVRLLGGFDAMTQPPGGVNSSHLHSAQAVLRSFDLVLLLESNTQPTAQLLMNSVLGWNLAPEAPRSNVMMSESSTTVSEELQQKLTEINKFDMELYAYAAQVQATLLRQFSVYTAISA